MYEPPTRQTTSPPYVPGHEAATPQPPPSFPSAPEPFPASLPPRRRNALPLLLVGALAVAMLGVAGYFVYDQAIRTDSGIAACEAMAEGGRPTEGGDGTAEFTADEYRELRGVFQDSRHDDIREAGTAMVDLLWQIEQGDDGNELGTALLFGGRAADAMTAMSGACANHGIVVKFKS
jgi:hypothetical protein